MTHYTLLESPIGPLTLTTDGTSLTGLHLPYPDGRPMVREEWVREDHSPLLAEARGQIAAYFEGRLRDFDLPLAPAGTPFQQQVWEALRQIPYGATISYGELARRIGRPGSARAVGLANGANPIAVILPCHRVIGANGKLVGYGGGLPRKEALLAFEAAVLASRPLPACCWDRSRTSSRALEEEKPAPQPTFPGM
jgi:methylated-DNA-[protein]-cysteine S-methyltransferase